MKNFHPIHPTMLITGTSGFLGGSLKKYFSALGYDVYGTVRSRPPVDDHEFQFDITHENALDALRDKNFDIIIHSLACLNHKRSHKFMSEVNYGGTVKILAYAKAHNCRHFIQLSTIAVYGIPVGNNKTETNIKRRLIANPSSYGKTKAHAEVAVENSGLPYTILRLPPMIGVDDTVVTPSIIKYLKKGFMVGWIEKESVLTVMNSKNLNHLILKIIQHGALNDCFNPVADHVPWKVLVAKYAQILHIPYTLKKKSICSMIPKLKDKGYLWLYLTARWGSHFNSEKLKNVLGGFNPYYSWEDGLRESLNMSPKVTHST
jgi:nucleoside-diphosphate-sugar epimerase